MVIGDFGGMNGFPEAFLKDMDLEHAKKEVQDSNKKIQLIIPSKYSQHERKTLPYILKELNKCDFIDKVNLPVVATPKTYDNLNSMVENNLELPYRIINCADERIDDIMYDLKDRGAKLPTYREKGKDKFVKGKGRDFWIGLIPSTSEADVIIYQDADITPDTYSERFPILLSWPLTAADKDFEFVKSYFYRLDKNKVIHGRVCRLFVGPLIKALKDVSARNDRTRRFLEYLDAFEYPLSGEGALTTNSARTCAIKPHYGLEIGILKEMFNNTEVKEEVYNIPLGRYDHAHQDKSGLSNMIKEITKTLFTSIAEKDPSFFANVDFLSLKSGYALNARKAVKSWDSTRHLGDFNIKRSEEDKRVDSFTRAFTTACNDWKRGDRGADELPTIESITSHMPNIEDRIKVISDEGK